MIGIAVPNYKIEPEVTQRFVRHAWNGFGLYIDFINKEDDLYTDGLWHVSRGYNKAIRRLYDKGCDIIICTDIDIMFPPDLLARTKDFLTDGKWVFIWTRYVNLQVFERSPSWEKLLLIPPRRVATGGFHAATAKTWELAGGWNEDIRGYGGEDDDMAKWVRDHPNIDLNCWADIPLMHINHETRNPRTEQHFCEENKALYEYQHAHGTRKNFLHLGE